MDEIKTNGASRSLLQDTTPINRRWVAATAVHVQMPNVCLTCEMLLFWCSSFHRNFPWEPTSICTVDLCAILIFHCHLLTFSRHIARKSSQRVVIWPRKCGAQKRVIGSTQRTATGNMGQSTVYNMHWYLLHTVGTPWYCAENGQFVWQRLQIFQIAFAFSPRFLSDSIANGKPGH